MTCFYTTFGDSDVIYLGVSKTRKIGIRPGVLLKYSRIKLPVITVTTQDYLSGLGRVRTLGHAQIATASLSGSVTSTLSISFCCGKKYY